MKRCWLISLFLLLLFSMVASAQQDSLQSVSYDSIAYADSIARAATVLDSIKLEQSLRMADNVPFYRVDSAQTVRYDVQQMVTQRESSLIVVILILLLLALTYVRMAFANDFEELLQSFANKNIAMQIFRTRTGEITFSSFLLHVNFVVVFGLFLHIVFVKFYPNNSLDSNASTFFFIILFTFFYLAKIFVIQLLGYLFDLKETAEEYIYSFSITFKTLGVVLIPTLFVLYAAPQKFFDWIFATTMVIIPFFILFFVFRGLSTGLKLMYKNTYHFFLYVCVVEISPIFLLFKLLTKTVV